MNYKTITQVGFPPPEARNVNMMPFVLGERASVPSEHHAYWPMIEACNVEPELMGKVGYLTITESMVEDFKSHRRGGVHVEAHGLGRNWGGGTGWGRGHHDDRPREGLYVASTCPDTTQVWDYRAKDEEIGEGGSMEHRRDFLNTRKSTVLTAGELCWLTDHTPHESLPMLMGLRQFFRLVTPRVFAWFKDKNTANPLGVMPAAPIV